MMDFSTLLDDLVEALDSGNFALVARILRAMKELERQGLDLLADFFDPNTPPSGSNRYGLYRVQRQAGGPRRRKRTTTLSSSLHQSKVSAQNFFAAIYDNDLAMAASILRALPSLKRRALGRLADLFDPHSFTRYKLRGKQRRVGRPSDPARKAVKATAVAFSLNRARRGTEKLEAAVAQVMADRHIQRSVVFDARRKRKSRLDFER